MLYEIGLITTVAVCAWLALDLLAAEGWRRRSPSIGVLGLGAALWATCELLIVGGRPVEQLAVLRTLLHLGGSAWRSTASCCAARWSPLERRSC
jgi:hypothetical protein